MTQRQKLELALNRPTEIQLLFDEPITGQSRYGDYYMYAVNSNGQEYSFFPVLEVHEKLKGLHKGDSAVITKTAAQRGNKLVTDYQVLISADKEMSKAFEDPQTEVYVSPVEENLEQTTDKLYDIMLQSYKDALRLNSELGGMIDSTRIAITLFIARSNGRMGG